MIDPGTLADALAARLSESGSDLTLVARARWEGALTVCEVLAGRAPSLVDDELAAEIRQIL